MKLSFGFYRKAAAVLFITSMMLNNLFAQGKYTSYYNEVHAAEALIMVEEYGRASDLYGVAFLQKPPNAKDLHNAYRAAYAIKDTLRAKKYVLAFASYGMKKRIIDSWSGNSQLEMKDDPFYIEISKGYDSIYQKAKEGPMPKVAAMINKLVEDDQRVRISNLKKMHSVDSANLAFLHDYIEKNGFPGFQQTGFFDRQMSPMTPGGGIGLIMWHQRGRTTILDSMLLDAVHKGNFPPEDYALLVDLRKETYHSALPRNDLDDFEKDDINYERGKIYLDDLLVYEEKLKYQAEKGWRFIFLNQYAYMTHELIKKININNN